LILADDALACPRGTGEVTVLFRVLAKQFAKGYFSAPGGLLRPE
jgi:hypothetical protein